MATFEALCQDIWRVEANIEEHATALRAELEELSDLARKLWESDEDYTAPNGERISDSGIQDLADAVSRIEGMFDKD